MVIGNKTDLSDINQVDKNTVVEFARRNKMLFIESSARTGEKVQIAFTELVRKIIQTPGLWQCEAQTENETFSVSREGNMRESGTSCVQCLYF